MGDKTEIAWTERTFNPWIGCIKIAPGCDNCYANDWDNRFGGGHWGKGNKPRPTADSTWKKPLKWNREAESSGVPIKVFCGSLCDWADKNAPDGQRERLWELIRQTPHLRWQMLTKRAPNIRKYLPADWGDGYPNVWLGVTVENQKHGLKRMNILRNIPAKVRFLSIEPLLEDLGELYLSRIHWVIVGGESGPRARNMHATWATNIMAQCQEQKVAFFFKQWGGRRDKGGCLVFGQERKQWPEASLWR